ncbi:MAG: aldo/keto reductase [Bacillota bacterium]
MKNIKLKSGDKIPALGLGTWQNNGKNCINSVKKAIELGYTHIDTADAYNNHKEVGKGIKKSGINRENLFLTTKIWRENLSYSKVISSGKRFLKELDTEYLDLLLIHWPNQSIPISETLKGMEELKNEGIVKNIGVSNFTINHLKEALEVNEDLITVNQVEFHPYLYQKKLLNFCQNNDIVITAYSPLARGEIFNDDTFKELSEKYDKSPAQLSLKWLVDKDIVVIPKASSESHIKDNMKIFDWKLPDKAKEKLDNMNKNKRIIDPPFGEFNY